MEVKNLIILLFIYITFLLHASDMLSMENYYEIITADSIKDKIPQKHLLLCKTICTMLKDFPNESGPISLPITSHMLPLIKDSLKYSYILSGSGNKKNSYVAKKALEIQLSTLPYLHAVLTFANQFDEPNLLKYCMKLWAKEKYNPSKIYSLPSELNISIAKYMEKSRDVINHTVKWTIKNLLEKEINFLQKKDLELSNSIWSIAISHDGNYVVGGQAYGTIVIYNLENDTFYSINNGHPHCSKLQFSKDDNQIWSSGENHTIKVWDLATGNNISTFLSSACSAFVFRHIPQHNILVTDTSNNNLHFWDLAHSHAIPCIVNAHHDKILALEAMHNGSLFASASKDGCAHIWDTATKHIIRTFKHDFGVMSIQFSHTKHRLVCGLENGIITVYDLVTAKKLEDKHKHTDGIWSVLYDEHDILLCSGSKDATVKLWDTRTYKPILRLFHTDAVQDMAINYPKNLLVSASHDKTVKIWDLRKLLTPLKQLRKEILNNCTIENMLMFENAHISKTPLKKNNLLLTPLLQKLSPDAQRFLIDTENIENI